ERHAGSPCVTASMDDIHFEHTISVGQVVNIRAKVNRAFNTSMEVGIHVSCEDLYLDQHWRVCHAYATFVTQRTKAGKKVMLKPLPPCTHTEHLEYSLAAERRRVRMLHDDIIRDLLASRAVEPGGSVVEKAVSAVKTRVESVELVLPPHANHQVNTFGGQIMAWMVNVATIAASRLCQAHPTLRGIDMFKFRGPSQVGDRLLLSAIVNNAFKNRLRPCNLPTVSFIYTHFYLYSMCPCSMEVGVRAEAYQAEGPNRHINSAFMIFEVLDKDGKPCLLPRIRPEPVVSLIRRFEEAIARKKIRLDRKYIISRQQAEVPLSVPWDPTNQVYLSYNNVSALKMLAAHHSWRLSSEKDQVQLYTVEHPAMLSFRVEAEVDVPAHRAFTLLSELSTRHQWDPHYKECELIRRVDADDFLYRVVTPPNGGAVGSPTSPPRGEGVLQDFILLASKRKPCASGDPYVIALRSVTLPTHPPMEGFSRGEVLCAGFTILETSDNKALISYYNQASAELLLPLISTDMAGLSSSFYHTFCSCRQYLTQHRLPSHGELEQDLSSLQRTVSSESQSSESETERLTGTFTRTHL
ncbi:hypothetical protein NL108_015495, partial [Boleophthalmus pectinirostris]